MEKTIDLCGLGNSLVDIQVNVDNDFISKHGLNKGEMRLTDFAFQSSVLKELKARAVNQCSGGSAANTIIAFTQFGGSAAYMSVLGDDENGKFYSGEFESLGIELRADFTSDEPTGTCLVLITSDSERTMCTSLGATGLFRPENLDEELIARSEWLYIEGYKFTAEPSTEAIFKALDFAEKHETLVALTFSDVFITSLYRKKLTEVAARADLVFCNEAEALSFTETDNLNDAAEKMGSMTKNFVITLGDKGALIRWDNKSTSVFAFPALPVDSTGAGDMFAGAFLFGIIYYQEPEFAGYLASYASSRIVSQMGARLNEDFNDIFNFIYDKWK